MKRYSVFAIAREALRYHTGWERAWRAPEPKPAYDAIIVGAGGHGLATAYYLGKNHGIRNVAIIEKGWLGGGNTGPQHHHHPVELSAGPLGRDLRQGAATL
jgi:sarcosine oxidase subunit beta